MTEQEKAKKLLPIIQAIADGKQIEYQCGNTWFDVPLEDNDDLSEVCKDIIFNIYEYRIKSEENYTIEQNCGENKVEGGVLSVSGSVSNELNKHCKWCKGKSYNCATCQNKDEENSYYLLHKDKFPEPGENDEYELPEPFNSKSYRPFKATAELILHYEKHFNVDYPPFYEPMMWVKAKDESDVRFFVTSFSEYYVKIDGEFVSMKKLFENFVFLDGSCIGQPEE